MKNRILTVLSLCLALHSAASDTDRMTRQEYIDRYKQDAVKDMQRTGVPASITLAQALLESDDGNSPLAREANNHFGIKCAEWTGPSVYQDDDKKGECFRKYGSVLESYDDHSDFLRNRQRYAFLFSLDLSDYKGWAQGLKKAGYATNPRYAEQLIKIIEDNNLQVLDKGHALPPVASSGPEGKMASIPKNIRKESEEIVNPFNERRVLLNNDVKYVIAKKGDTYKKISDEFQMAPWEIYKYNDADRNDALTEGQMVYIKPKRNKGSEATYTALDGETVISISMKLGIKSKKLCKYNGLDINSRIQAGQVLWLQGRKPSGS